MKWILLNLAACVIMGPALCAAAYAADRSAGLELAKKSGCLACHSIDKKIVGPPWMDVSKRYLGDASARERLIKKRCTQAVRATGLRLREVWACHLTHQGCPIRISLR